MDTVRERYYTALRVQTRRLEKQNKARDERSKVLTRLKNYLLPKLKYWSSCAVTCLVIHVIMEVAGI